jgi:hypothetical protein
VAPALSLHRGLMLCDFACLTQHRLRFRFFDPRGCLVCGTACVTQH